MNQRPETISKSNIKIPNPSQEPPLSSKAPNQDEDFGCLHIQDREPKFGTSVYQRPVTISKSVSRYETPVSTSVSDLISISQLEWGKFTPLKNLGHPTLFARGGGHQRSQLQRPISLFPIEEIWGSFQRRDFSTLLQILSFVPTEGASDHN